MNPVLEGALIGGAVAVAVAVVGSLITVRTTRMALNAARSDRRWDRKAAAYLDAMAYLSDRRAKRQAYLSVDEPTREDRENLDKYFASYSAPRWFDVSAALLAFAPYEVLGALENANTAASKARRAYEQWKQDDTLRRRNDIEGRPGREAEAAFVMDALATFQVRMREAEASEETLMGLMHDDLDRNPGDDHPPHRATPRRVVRPPGPA